MVETPKSERIGIALPGVQHEARTRGLPRFLSYLVFEGHGLRIGIELSACIVSYTLATLLIPWERLGVAPKWSTLISWFGCCFLIILFDQLVLCRSVYTLRRAYLFAMNGLYDRALEVLERIGPASTTLVRLPLGMYHLQRAEFLLNTSRLDEADVDLAFAELAGAPSVQLQILRSHYLLSRGNIAAAESALEGDNPTLVIERGIFLLTQKKDNYGAKKLFAKAMEMADAPHHAGESTQELARAYWNVSRLYTGEAEEALEALYPIVDRLRGAIGYVDTLRPILSQLLLERALYFSTHKEPSSAIIDVKVALATCSYSYLTRRADQVREELRWRHGIGGS